MNETSLEKRRFGSVREDGKYAVGLGVIGLIMYLVGFPLFVVVFFGALIFFIWKIFVSEPRAGTRRVFEFYLVANEILRDDDRHWYGFEIKEAIARGEDIVKSMSIAPPLVHFALGALYQRIEDHSSAVRHLEFVAGDSSTEESAIMFPSRDLREYVEMLRRIERAPAASPQTSAAIRSLERARRNRSSKMLAQSHEILNKNARAPIDKFSLQPHDYASDEVVLTQSVDWYAKDREVGGTNAAESDASPAEHLAKSVSTEKRKSISEVLHDIYDKSVQ